MIELSLLRTFVAIVDQGNFLAAAQAVARSPSAVSVQIQRLEERVGRSLFVRDARTTRLTPDGDKLLPHARRMLAQEAALMAEFQTAPVRGAVRLGVPDDVVERFPMQALTRFTDEHPGITLTIGVGHTPALLRDVEAGRLDLAIVTYAESIPGITSAERLFGEPEVWAASTSGIAWERDPLPVTLWDEGWAWHEPTVRLLEKAQINFIVVLQCENIGARKAAIRADLAVGPLPVSQLDDEVGPAPNLQHVHGLPEYGLGLKLADDYSEAVEAVANHLRGAFSSGRLGAANR
jgi:DNA-binding transcriptional LysR family regulator